MGDVNHEPSMEEILASIKRIIAEDGEGVPVVARRGRGKGADKAAPVPPEGEADDEVLELTHRLDVPPPPGREEQLPSEFAGGEPEMPEQQSETPPQTGSEEPLVSAAARQASRQAIAALSAMVVRPDPPGADTLEGMVRDMLKPMLKEWLDARLPDLVEQVVAREIARIVEARS